MTHHHQTAPIPWSASLLRRDLNARAQHLAATSNLLHEQTTGSEPSILFGHQEKAEQGRHGNFHPASYAAICANPAWSRRLIKAHTAYRRVRARADWQWKELDCANSSDALLMNIFCHPTVFSDDELNPAVANLLGVPTETQPNFGIRPGVPLKRSPASKMKTRRPTTQTSASALFSDANILPPPSLPEEEHPLKDRTEIDLQLGKLFVEAKLTESNFQTASPRLIERYRDLETIFAVERLPSKILTPQTHPSSEDFSDLEEPPMNPTSPTPTSAHSRTVIQGYQLIRNVLAAFAADASFCVLCDARRHDLIEIWYSVLSTVHYPNFTWRLKLLTWQELSTVLPEDLQQFLEAKYGILPA
jgi:hypothetical protein